MRGKEVSRVEAFSDVVFGFALTLIVVSLEVPQSYAELLHAMGGFLGFAICFSLLTWIWHVHHTFFRRYAMTDELTIALNTVLLFLVLFYIYPMKFVFELMTDRVKMPGLAEGSRLLIIYGLGFAGIFAVFLLLYLHAWRKRKDLELNIVEEYDTKSNMIMYGAYVFIGLVSVSLANIFPTKPWLSGWTYYLIGPVSAGIGFWRGMKRVPVEAALQESGAATPDPVAQAAAAEMSSPA